VALELGGVDDTELLTARKGNQVFVAHEGARRFHRLFIDRQENRSPADDDPGFSRRALDALPRRDALGESLEFFLSIGKESSSLGEQLLGVDAEEVFFS
jgi:hypothetical protein